MAGNLQPVVEREPPGLHVAPPVAPPEPAGGLLPQRSSPLMHQMENRILTTAGEKGSFVLARNSQGFELRGSLLRLTRYEAVFEVYNPYSLLQLSEVLTDFRIMMDDRVVYAGRAVVSNAVNTGIMLICEATLDDAWAEPGLFAGVTSPGKLRGEFAAFVDEWRKIEKIAPSFKALVADLQAFLLDLRRWLEQVELGIRSEPSGSRQAVERSVIAELEEPILPTMASWFTRFDEASDQVSAELRPVHRVFARRLLHPLVLCSPFVYRTYHKPLGYAGDYEMVNMILREPCEGASLFAKLVNVCFLKNPPAEAHRNRIRRLVSLLAEETARVVQTGRRARILNLGCGPAQEARDFLKEHAVSDHADFLFLDFNEETLDHASRSLTEAKAAQRRETGLAFQKRSVHQVLKEGGRPGTELSANRFDFVYCAGLFDYMSDRICKRLMNIFHDLLAPGGLLLATNVDAAKPFRHSMEMLLEWHLNCRTRAQLETLLPDAAAPETCRITAEDTGVNVFLEVRKPAHGR